MKYFSSIVLLFLLSCNESIKNSEDTTVYVSIAPLAYLVEQLADSTISVEVLVPETTSPETFEPTTAQIQKLSTSRAYINTGLIDFEAALNKSISGMSDSLIIVDLSDGVDIVAGSCGHDSHEGHAHGVDPHTWLSPRLMRQFALRISSLLDDIEPTERQKNAERLERLLSQIDSLDRYISAKKLTSFAIAHPSLTYYAQDYQVEQIAIEIEGKEPAISQMKEMINRLKSEKISKIFYQKQTSAAAAQTIAKEVGAEVIEFDPLSHDWLNNMYYITDQIAR